MNELRIPSLDAALQNSESLDPYCTAKLRAVCVALARQDYDGFRPDSC